MRKDEKVENTIEKIQRDYMRYTQLKLNGFRTLIGSERDEYNGTRKKEGKDKKQNTLRGTNIFNQNGDLLTVGGDASKASRRKANNKSSLSFIGKMVVDNHGRIEYGRAKVGFEDDSMNPKREHSRQVKNRYKSIDTASDKQEKFRLESQLERNKIEDEIRDRSASQRQKERGKMMRELYHRQLNHIFLSNDHRANFYKGEANHIIEQIEGFTNW